MKAPEIISRLFGLIGWSIFFGGILALLLTFYLAYCVEGDVFAEILKPATVYNSAKCPKCNSENVIRKFVKKLKYDTGTCQDCKYVTRWYDFEEQGFKNNYN